MAKVGGDAIRFNKEAGDLLDAREFEQAVALYRRASELAPDWHSPHYNMGVAFKHWGRWAECVRANLRALELDREGAGEGALWNIGVAATALSDWPRARWAWTEFGIRLPEGDGPIDMNIGNTPIRINPHEEPEVVWCHRIDPARARIDSIPTPGTGRRYHDLVLHDGEPKGKRRYGEDILSVFDELCVLEASRFRTWGVQLVAPTEEDVIDLYRTVANSDSEAALEDWTASLHIMCKQCSEGEPHPDHDHPKDKPWVPERRLGVATEDDDVFEMIASWARGKGRAASEPELLLE